MSTSYGRAKQTNGITKMTELDLKIVEIRKSEEEKRLLKVRNIKP